MRYFDAYYCVILTHTKFINNQTHTTSMKKNLLKLCFVLLGVIQLNLVSAQVDTKSKGQTDSKNAPSIQMDTITSRKKEVKNRNVMLNAASNIGPRNVNIGLPFEGDVTILENDLPVVYSFWPQIPTTVWRYDASIGRIGLLNFSETAITNGKVGYAVNSYDRFAGSIFKGYASFMTNQYGLLRGELNISGPIKKGWGYTLSAYENFDPGTLHYDFTKWDNRTQIFKGGITKAFDRGSVSLLYKYAESKAMYGIYGPFIYEGNGKTKELDNFRLGQDSYIVNDGIVGYYDKITGEKKTYDIDKARLATSNSIELTGDYKFSNSLKISFSSMYSSAKAPFILQYPVNSMSPGVYQAQGYSFIHIDDKTPYNGPVQLTLSNYIPAEKITTIQNRVELKKTFSKQELRFALHHQYNNEPLFENVYSLYYHTIEPNPRKLSALIYMPNYHMSVPITDENGVIPSAAGRGGEVRKSKVNKIALYFTDDWRITNRFSLSIGGRIENVKSNGSLSPYLDQVVGNRPLKDYDFNMWNKTASISTILELIKNGGIAAEATYTETKQDVGVWSTDYTESLPNNQPVKYMTAGVYFKHKVFNVVSNLTYIQKENYVAALNVYNPNNARETQTLYPVLHDIETLGWTTDIVSNPFGSFNMHFLLTLQNPVYRNYNINAFGKNYSFDGKTIPELSKTLIEIDPSYTFMKGKLRTWVSLRYFGKQQATCSNVLYFKGWWENFTGVEYRVNRKLDFKLQVVNFLNQRGVARQILGSELITDPTPYVNTIMTSGYIRPFTTEFTINYKF